MDTQTDTQKKRKLSNIKTRNRYEETRDFIIFVTEFTREYLRSCERLTTHGPYHIGGYFILWSKDEQKY